MNFWQSASEWLMDTKGHPVEVLKRRKFLKQSGAVLGALATIPLVGCGNEPTPEPEYVDDGTPSGTTCPVDFPTGFYCDASSESGAKHTPQITTMIDNGDRFSMMVNVPHVVNANHHILGCQVVAYIPEAVNPHVWLDFHYYTNEYILAADDSEWSHQFEVAKESINEAASHLMVFSICNKHGNYGEITQL